MVLVPRPTMPTPLRPLAYAALCLAGPLADGAAAQDARPLQPGEAVEDSLSAGDVHAYEVSLDAGQSASGEVDQATVDVVVWVTGPDGERVGRYDGLARGPEPFAFEATGGGAYTVRVAPYRGAGRYGLALRSPETGAGARERVRGLLTGYDGPDRPGVAATAVGGGAVRWTLALGGDPERDAPFTAETAVPLYGLSRAFAAYALAALAERGAVDLDAEVQSALPALEGVGPRLTGRDLVLQRAGYDDASARAVVQAVSPTPLADPLRPDAADYAVMAALVEAAMGEPFGAWLQAHVFAPLGMAQASVPTPLVAAPPLARYGLTPADRLVEVRPPPAVGYVHASALDVARWLLSVDSSAYGRAVAAAAPDGSRARLGAVGGLDLMVDGDVTRYDLETDAPGLSVRVEFYPGRGAGLVLITNGPEHPTGARTPWHTVSDAWGRVADAALGDARLRSFPSPPPPPPPAATGPPEGGWTRFLGRYTNDDAGTLAVAEGADGLTVQLVAASDGLYGLTFEREGSAPVPIGYYRRADKGTEAFSGEGLFRGVWFKTAEDESVRSLVVSMAGEAIRFQRDD